MKAAQIAAILLIATVVTQILYMAFLGGPQPSDPAQGTTQADVVAYFTDRWAEVATIWTVEVLAFAGVAMTALVVMARGGGSQLAWAAIALAALVNLIQLGLGLAVFRPIALAEQPVFGLFGTVVAGAFYFYFLAKALIGVAAIALGTVLFKSSTATPAKIVSGITALLGVIALGANIAGIAQGMGWVLIAGASGTLATMFVAIAGVMAVKRSVSD
ncbi:hypothetical protein GCM10022213_12410 [Parerythrobacter jejuensis]